jgi:predicted metal-dependent HD superfamily phosphohydrolase
MPTGAATSPDKMLENSWRSLVRRLGAEDAAEAVFEQLVRHYAVADRAYHNLGHVASVLQWIETLQGCAACPDAVRLAGWFHDVIYDPRLSDNEERSADYAGTALAELSVDPGLAKNVERLILLTKTHEVEPHDRDGEVLLDADLAILGAPAAEYAEYARAIRQEYAWVPEDAYRSGRRAVLERFLQRPRLFHTPPLLATREATARSNLRAELRDLGAGL